MSIHLEITQTQVQVGSRGKVVSLDLTRLSHDILRQFVSHGIVQKVGDSASAAKQSAILAKFGDDFNKADAEAWAKTPQGEEAIATEAERMMQKAIDALYEGKWAIRESTGMVTKWTEEQSLALELAKAELATRFKRACLAKGLPQRVGSFPELGEAVAKYFTSKGKATVWQDKVVMEWIETQVDKRDYMAEARETLASMAAAAEDIDLEDLLA